MARRFRCAPAVALRVASPPWVSPCTSRCAGPSTPPRAPGSIRQPAAAAQAFDPTSTYAAGDPLDTGELGGDALGVLQNRVDVLCLDEFVGLQVLEGPGAAHRQAGRGGRPGIGEFYDGEAVVLAEHQVVGLKLAPRGLDRPRHDRQASKVKRATPQGALRGD